MLDELDARGEGSTVRRAGTRMAYRSIGVLTEIEQLGGGTTKINVACRNLSSGGVGFLHSSFVHNGTRVTLHLPHLDLGPTPVRGSVVRCRHITRHIHEVGVKFDADVDVYDFVAADTLNQLSALEAVDPAKLTGQMLVAAAYEMDRLLARQHVANTSLGVVTAGTVAEAAALLSRPIDVVLIDYELPDGKAAEFMAKMYDTGARPPVIVLSAASTPEIRRNIREAGAQGLLVKPFTQPVLLRALAEVLIGRSVNSPAGPAGAGAGASGGGGGGSGGGGGALTTSLPPDSPLRPLLQQFVDDVRKFSEELPGLIKQNDTKGVRMGCERVLSTAPVLGFEALGAAAASALRVMQSADQPQAPKSGTGSSPVAQGLADSHGELRDLLSLCKRVRLSKAA